MNVCAERFLETLKNNDMSALKVSESEEGLVRVTTGINLKTTKIEINFIFEEENVAIRCYSLLKVSEDQFASALICCNELNCSKKWVKFCIDDEYDVNIEMDAVLEPETSGKEVFDLMIKLCLIADIAYPKLNKAIWS